MQATTGCITHYPSPPGGHRRDVGRRGALSNDSRRPSFTESPRHCGQHGALCVLPYFCGMSLIMTAAFFHASPTRTTVAAKRPPSWVGPFFP